MVFSKKRRPSSSRLISPRTLFENSDEEVEVFCRERVAPVPFGNGQTISRYLARFKLLTRTDDFGFAPHMVMDGYWEMGLTRWMVGKIEKGWTAFDVGANFGYYSVLLADLVGKDGRLVAFEPNPDVAGACRFSLAINDFEARSQLHEVALADREGSCSFFVPANEPKNGHLVPGTPSDRRGTSFQVQMTTLDKVAQREKQIDFIKIDAEGAESAIFEGMQETIAKHNPLIVLEYNADREGSAGLARRLEEVYPKAGYMAEDGTVNDLPYERLSQENVGKDWLLILKR